MALIGQPGFQAKSIQFPVEIDDQVMDAVLNNFTFLNQFNEEEIKHWHFWKHLNKSKILNIQIITPVSKALFFYRNNPLFCSRWWIRSNPKSRAWWKRIPNPRTIESLVFLWTFHTSSPLEKKKKIQQMFLNTFHDNTNFSDQDSFTLFDYRTIPNKKWEKYVLNYNNDQVELKGDHCLIRVRTGRDGGCILYSIVHIWHLQTAHGFLRTVHQELKTILEKSIITPDRNWVRDRKH